MVHVKVTAEYSLYITRLKNVDNFVPVTQVLIERKVIDEDNGLLCRSSTDDGIEPQNLFAGDVRRSHT